MKKRREVVIHPFLFSLYSILTLIATNYEEIYIEDAYRSIVFAIVIAGIVFTAIRIFIKDSKKAGFFSTGFLLIFFSYGILYNLINGFDILGVAFTRDQLLFLFYLLFSISLIWWATRENRDFKMVTQILNATGVALVLFPLATIASIFFQYQTFSTTESNLRLGDELNYELNQDNSDTLPDIYYIILDGYGRGDVLNDLYGFDNQEFLNSLSMQGFFIAENSYSNYSKTVLSLASSLNFRYLDEFSEQIPTSSKPLDNLVESSKTVEILQEFGYESVEFDAGYRTNIFYSDYFLSPNNEVSFFEKSTKRLNAFESVYLNTTLVRVFSSPQYLPFGLKQNDLEPQYVIDQRNRVLFSLNHFPDISEWKGNYFVFVHIVAPHPPFLFDAQGNSVTPKETLLLRDGDHYLEGPEEYISGYIEQLQFINKLVQEGVEKILSNSNIPPVIIIQGDHGPGAYLVWESLEDSNLEERMAILNAYYFPGGDQGLLNDNITPVNSFRLVFNRYFDFEFELLPNKMNFSLSEEPFNYFDVTDDLENN